MYLNSDKFSINYQPPKLITTDGHSLTHTYTTHTNCYRDHAQRYFSVSCIPWTAELKNESLKQKLKPLFHRRVAQCLKILHWNGWVTKWYDRLNVCKCIRNWPLPIGVFQDQWNKYSNKHNKVKNPNWLEADQLAIYKCSREVELGATENNIS